MKKVLIFACLCEAVTGLALLVVPSLVGQLLFGEELTGLAIPIARLTGIALVALAIACWQDSLAGMLAYNAAVTLYLSCIGIAGGLTGVLLWPAAAFHLVMSILLSRAWLAAEAK